MSKQEIKDEVKEMEGNPQMKARIRRLQRDRARRQMMKEVPKATAVIVNPTHYAVAPLPDGEHGRAHGGGQGQELSGAAHPPEGHRAPGSDHRESAAGAGAVQVGGRGPGDSGALLSGGGRNPGVYLQAHEWETAAVRAP